ncbi:MAG: hypothetical protein FD159_689 [Syntrophaceae bacterium]|nr:MAG: hypothetical protein FD159_689 [Syntrophaceae bacterium]
MEAQEDFKELLALFNGHKVEYMIVGAYALAYHGAPRFTGDIDIFVKPSLNNTQRILSALSDFGFGSLNLTIDDFQNPDSVVQLSVPPVRIDIIPSITGVTWLEADHGKQEGVYGDIPVYFLGREQYIANKRAIGRKKDIADLESLGEE